MDKLSDIVSSPEFLARRDIKDSDKDLDPMTIMVVNRLFNFFEALCPGYEKQYAGNDSKLKMQKVNFARAFMDEGISDIRQVELGVKRCRRESPINTPTVGQFLSWCKPSTEDLGLLPKETAYNRAYELIRDGDITGMSEEQITILRHVITESNTYFLKNNPMSKTQPVFYRNYEIAVRDYMAGNLQSISKGIEDRNTETSELKKQDEVKKGFENLRGYKDNIAWMKRMLGMKIGTSDA